MSERGWSATPVAFLVLSGLTLLRAPFVGLRVTDSQVEVTSWVSHHTIPVRDVVGVKAVEYDGPFSGGVPTRQIRCLAIDTADTIVVVRGTAGSPRATRRRARRLAELLGVDAETGERD